MLFNSIHYFIFAPIAIWIYFQIPYRMRHYFMLAASLYFYAVFRVPFLLILIFCLVLTHYFSILIFHSTTEAKKKVFLFAGIFLNLSILYFFKYVDFSFRAFNQIVRMNPCEGLQPWGVILPMGISFFTLQAISFLVDVYRGIIGPARNLLHFALFLSFFPQLVAGPIMRAKDLLHQFQENHDFDTKNLYVGLRLITVGLFKKTLIADSISGTVDTVFHAPHLYSWSALYLGAILFVIQIYCDFSGYSDIAIGTGRVLGFRIPENFSRPFLAQSMTQLWRRWHISLSTWLRDYIYVPLGGSRVSFYHASWNLLVSFVVGGIWHGADWTFVFWGFSHSAVIVTERYLLSKKQVRSLISKIPGFVKVGYTFLLFAFLAVFFRSQPVSGNSLYNEGMDVAMVYFKRIISLEAGGSLSIGLPQISAILLLFVLEGIQEKFGDLFQSVWERPYLVYSISGIVMGLCFFIYSVTISPQFIYFQF